MKKHAFVIFLVLTSFFLATFALFLSNTSPTKYLRQKAENVVKLCKDSKRADFCYIDAFSEFGKNNDISSSLSLLKEIQEKDPKTNNCHFIAHVIAFEELKKNPESWEQLFTEISVDACTGGYLMGILEGYQLNNDTSLNKQTIPEICSRIAQKINASNQISPESSCDHIMGHLLLAQEGSIDNALAICKSLSSTSQKECFAGVFMESEVQRNISLHTKKDPMKWTEETTADQESICKKYEGVIASSCWRELSHMLVFMESSFPPDVYERCHTAPSTSDSNECYIHGVGIMVVSSRFDDNNLSLLCKPYEKESIQMDSCIRMIVGTLLGSSPSLADTVIQFCKTTPLAHQRYCYNRLGIGLSGDENPNLRVSTCQKIPKEYQQICLNT